MLDKDQMSRQDLLDARERVSLQLGELTAPEDYKGFRPMAELPLVNRLRAILQEIDNELAELDAKNP